MSLQHSVTATPEDPASSASAFAAMRQIFLPLVQEARNCYRARRIIQTRKATQNEISALPGNLREDLAFRDGTDAGACRL